MYCIFNYVTYLYLMCKYLYVIYRLVLMNIFLLLLTYFYYIQKSIASAKLNSANVKSTRKWQCNGGGKRLSPFLSLPIKMSVAVLY